jgi:hypothetical protein
MGWGWWGYPGSGLCVVVVHRPGAGVLEPSREFWNRQLFRFAAQFVKPLSALCVCTGFVWDLQMSAEPAEPAKGSLWLPRREDKLPSSP